MIPLFAQAEAARVRVLTPTPISPRWPIGHFVLIEPSGAVIAQIIKHEMGQGIASTLAALLAEEMEADWNRVEIRFLSHTEAYSFSSGGSTAIRDWWLPVRKAGALARNLLSQAAAAQWNAKPDEVRAERHAIVHADGRRLGFGEVAAAASLFPVVRDFNQFSESDIALKPAEKFSLLGQRFPRKGVAEIVLGTWRYGIDHTPEGALTALIVRSPTFRGRLKRYAADSVAGMPGVHALVPMRGIPLERTNRSFVVREGVAIVADSYWNALKARERLQVEWEPGDFPHADDAAYDAACTARLQDEVEPMRAAGEWSALAQLAPALDETYIFPHQTHATMEPLSASARVDGDKVEVWIGSQSPRLLMIDAERHLGVPSDRMTVHCFPSGGSFGRRYFSDIGIEAIQVASAVAPRPVKVVWSREDDLRCSMFHFQSTQRQRIWLDDEGGIAGWHMRDLRAWGRELPWVFAYAIPCMRYDHVDGVPDTPVPTCAWRSVTGVGWGFAVESAMDELAHKVGQDPLEYRLRHIPQSGEGDLGHSWKLDYARLRHVLEVAAERSGWGRKPPQGSARGVALCNYKDLGMCAHVVEMTERDGRPHVTRVVSVVDCGLLVDPDNAEQQVVGNVVWGLTAALHGGVPIHHGVPQWQGFAQNRLLTMPEMPKVEVHFVNTHAEVPLGLGEIPLPPLMPAVANAWFALTGKRARRLPVAAA